jgi:hypothetical protein
MSKVFKDSHAKDLEKLAADRLREAEKKAMPVHPAHETDEA